MEQNIFLTAYAVMNWFSVTCTWKMEKEIATHSSILAWRIPWTEESGFPGSSEVKASARNAGDLGSIPGLARLPWRRKWQPTPLFLPGESHGRRSLVDYSPRGRKEWGTTEWLHFHFLVFLPEESQGGWSLVGCRLWGPTESDTTESI